MPENARFSIKEMARWLEMRKNNNNPTVLLLGAQAGALFRSEHFFRCLREFSQRDVSSFSRIAQFSEYHLTLTDNLFSEKDIHSIFRTSLQDSAPTKSDLCLAELIKQEHFDEIICTNIDDLLEQSFLQIEMREQKDFELFLPDQSLLSRRDARIRVIKVFGDFSQREYNLKRYLDRSNKGQEQISALGRILAKDLLMVGVDSKWDKHILDEIPSEPGTGMLWLVSEQEDISKEEPIAGLLRRRQSQSILGREGQFDYFIKALHGYLYGGTPLNYQVSLDISNQLFKISTQLDDLSNKMQFFNDGYKTTLGEIKGEIKAIQERFDKYLQR